LSAFVLPTAASHSELSTPELELDMKAIVATVLLAAAIASPALAQSTRSQQGARSGQSTQSQQGARSGQSTQSQQGSGQNAGGTYQGYPTSAWQRPGSW
jgi:hypothetical protein